MIKVDVEAFIKRNREVAAHPIAALMESIQYPERQMPEPERKMRTQTRNFIRRDMHGNYSKLNLMEWDVTRFRAEIHVKNGGLLRQINGIGKKSIEMLRQEFPKDA